MDQSDQLEQALKIAGTEDFIFDGLQGRVDINGTFADTRLEVYVIDVDVATLDAAFEKLRLDAIAERKKKNRLPWTRD